MQLTEWVQNSTFPTRFPHQHSHLVQRLWLQRQQLVVNDNILCRIWEDIPSGVANRHLQCILPRTLVNHALEQLHSSPIGGHLGIRKTAEKVQCRSYWPGWKRDTEHWCRTCESCQSRKSPSQSRRAPMQTILPGRPFQRVTMDILGPLPKTERGNKYILVIGDYFTKWMEAIPIPDMEATTVSRKFVDNFICQFGCPDQIHTDQGRNFATSNQCCSRISGRLLNIEKTRTTPYHPQSDRLVERFNRTLLNMLSITATEDPDNWDLQLPQLMCAYRTSIQETTNSTPYHLVFGREA